MEFSNFAIAAACGGRKTADMFNRDAPRKWLERMINQSPRGTRVKLAEALGYSPGQITKMLEDKPGKETRDISAAEMMAMIEFFTKNPVTDRPELTYERFPEGAELPGEPWRGAVSTVGTFDIPKGHIAQLDATHGLGYKSAAELVNVQIGVNSYSAVPAIGTWQIPESVLHRRSRTSISDLFFVECEGNSMLPLIRDGDVVLVDQSRKNPRMGGIFALWEGDALTVRQVEIADGADPVQLRLMPANKDFSSKIVVAEEVRIIGRYVARFTMD